MDNISFLSFPEYKKALTSICEAICSNISFLFPVRILITPPGTSDEFTTSAKVIEHNGKFSEANTTQVFPLAIMGIMVETKPIKLFAVGAKIEITPVGSGEVKLK